MSTVVHLACRPRLIKGARLRFDEVRQTDFLLLPEKVVQLNKTGAAILRLCDGRQTVLSLIEILKQNYNQEFSIEDVLEFLHDVAQQGWIEISEQ